ncbi:MAG: hypothetical protein HQ582_32225 [Planctomycetes bacterium]|nr:hypothetical protein [Planctomycetota bacterium]
MTSQRQIAANRRNAKRSTGPKTPAGKAASSANSLRHGLTAATTVLPDEAVEVYEAFRQALVDELAPATVVEAILVDRIVDLAWRLRRVGRVEADIFRRRYFGALADRARKKASTYTEVDRDPFEGMLTSYKVVDAEAHDQACKEAEEAEAMRDTDIVALASGFEQDSAGPDSLGKLNRYETSLERSFYRALDELEHLQVRRGV